jgi:hypothetical protein
MVVGQTREEKERKNYEKNLEKKSSHRHKREIN